MALSFAKFTQTIFKSPALKTLASGASAVATGVLSSAFVMEISAPSGLAWGAFYRANSFYLLIVLSALLYLYNWALYKYETTILQFLDNDYCTAYVRSQCLPELAEKAKEQIRNGSIRDFSKTMDELKRGLR